MAYFDLKKCLAIAMRAAAERKRRLMLIAIRQGARLLKLYGPHTGGMTPQYAAECASLIDRTAVDFAARKCSFEEFAEKVVNGFSQIIHAFKMKKRKW